MTEISVPYVTLNDNNQIPQLGLGVWRAREKDAELAVREAMKTGYRLIDTAMIYQNEAAVGRAIEQSGVAREDIFVTTKLWNSDQGYDEALVAADKSLETLGLDYVDMYLIHWPMPEHDRYIDSWRALEELQKNGKVRSIGVSNFNQEHLEKLLQHAEVKPVVNQVEIHPDFQQTELRQYCKEHSIAVESWSPLGQGGDLLKNPTIVQIAEDHAKSPAQVVLRWHMQSDLIVIPKSVHADRIHENIDIFDFELTESDMAAIKELDGDNRLGPDPATMNSM